MDEYNPLRGLPQEGALASGSILEADNRQRIPMAQLGKGLTLEVRSDAPLEIYDRLVVGLHIGDGIGVGKAMAWDRSKPCTFFIEPEGVLELVRPGQTVSLVGWLKAVHLVDSQAWRPVMSVVYDIEPSSADANPTPAIPPYTLDASVLVQEANARGEIKAAQLDKGLTLKLPGSPTRELFGRAVIGLMNEEGIGAIGGWHWTPGVDTIEPVPPGGLRDLFRPGTKVRTVGRLSSLRYERTWREAGSLTYTIVE
jgi:hypothetical protein